MRRQPLTILGRISALIILGGPVLAAQGVQTGNLAGTVLGPDGQPIPRATVVLKTPQGDRVATTDAHGAYRFSLLNPGPVQLVISADGYISAKADARVGLGVTVPVDVSLRKVAVSEGEVIVEASFGAGPGNVSEFKQGKNFSLEGVNAAPINQRDILNIAALSPGTSQDANGLTIRGSQSTQVGFLVDGADVVDPVTGGPSVRLNEEMLEEVQVVTGAASAEYGRFTGGLVNTVTKSGTNEFAGTFRWDVTNPAWNAYNPKNRGGDGKSTFANHHQVVQQYMVSGPIVKDHLFFVLGYRTTSPGLATASTTSGVDGAGNPIGAPFFATRTEERKDVKLEWQVTPSHKVFWQYNQAKSMRANIDYPTFFGLASSTVATLSSQADTFSYVTFGYQGQIGSSMLVDLRFNHKKEQLGGPGSGGQGGKAITWIDSQSGTVYDNGFFGEDPDSRPIRTANGSITWILEGAGTHELKIGAQLYESKHNAANSQAPSNMFIWFNGFVDPSNPDFSVGNRKLEVNDPTTSYLDVWVPAAGATARNRIDGYYVNDQWKVNSHWSLNLGLRYDVFKSEDDLGRSNFSFKDLSPRLSASWDPKGDGRWGVQASYGVYVGQVIQGATDGASVVGNPAEYRYTYQGGDPLQRGSYSATPFYVYDPATYRQDNRVDSGLRSPRMQETSLSLKHSSPSTSWSLTATHRSWDRFSDDQVGDIDADTGVPVVTLRNDPALSRKYWGLEAQLQQTLSPSLSAGFTLTWSSLKGNYEGGQVGTTDQVNNYGSQPIPRQLLGPSGHLQADVPLAFLGNLTYARALGKGKLNVGALQYFTSGAAYSKTVTAPSLAPSGYAATFLQYTDGRGGERFASTYHTDVQVAYERPILRRLTAFARLNVTNLFNHQMRATWNTTGAVYGNAAHPLPGGYGPGAYALPWAPGAKYGQATGAGNYLTARTFNLAGGFRF